MREYLIGTGGWAYFNVGRLHPLTSYSRAFNFVEVNSTFYQIPPLKEVERWRNRVRSDFQFSVKAYRTLAQIAKPEWTKKAFATLGKMKQICTVLRTDLLHIQVPASFQPTQAQISELRNFVLSADLEKLRLVLEIRGVRPSKLPTDLIRLMEDHNMIHCVDVSKDEMPAYESDIVYSRLFGKGQDNVYQPTDEELARIDAKVSEADAQKIVMSFHFVRMYKDAARLRIYKQTGAFPKITGSIGLSSLEEVLSEDTKFPSTKQELMHSQGWKLFDLSEDKRVNAKYFLQKLAEKTYFSVGEVIRCLESPSR